MPENNSNVLKIAGAFVLGSALTALFFLYLLPQCNELNQVSQKDTEEKNVPTDSSNAFTLAEIPVMFGGTYTPSTTEDSSILYDFEVTSVDGTKIEIERNLFSDSEVSKFSVTTQDDTVFTRETCTLGEIVDLIGTSRECVVEAVTLSDLKVGDNVTVKTTSSISSATTDIVAVDLVILSVETEQL